MAKSKIVKVTDKIAKVVTGGYQKIEDGAVGGFTKLADGFVDQFLTREGESVEDAKKRIAQEQATHEEAAKKEREEHEARQRERIAASKERARNTGKHQ